MFMELVKRINVYYYISLHGIFTRYIQILS